MSCDLSLLLPPRQGGSGGRQTPGKAPAGAAAKLANGTACTCRDYTQANQPQHKGRRSCTQCVHFQVPQAPVHSVYTQANHLQHKGRRSCTSCVHFQVPWAPVHSAFSQDLLAPANRAPRPSRIHLAHRPASDGDSTHLPSG